MHRGWCTEDATKTQGWGCNVYQDQDKDQLEDLSIAICSSSSLLSPLLQPSSPSSGYPSSSCWSLGRSEFWGMLFLLCPRLSHQMQSVGAQVFPPVSIIIIIIIILLMIININYPFDDYNHQVLDLVVEELVCNMHTCLICSRSTHCKFARLRCWDKQWLVWATLPSRG